MFIELPNETRINTEDISSYSLYKTTIIITLRTGDRYIDLKHDSLEDAKLALYALDRAIGIKPFVIRK